ncbi:histidinol-phosphatase NDAI_0B04590 [Naumovozyma dairenensis CBS 421]|uniref:Histidinol-phosphatase n=1 Tax=Naumovozyma dairenensis (strain ATCC 10597 / BCRC 20456 / CBS 421 / NBRC 0211 / NRRL Y-12639) TaxID=1071378 RepID=G0W6T3_NAUDC|nr:hypothetical protein NDAI_0B04590 [Naumovozyma dairenensis CBS 421]CCD23494.1 hypothetical protein NDAI_0B04590 [Naumovozyma dairenensis CBS 421]
MHSHHSHSGDYVAHGVDCLELMVDHVIKADFHTYCLTEHMPRLEYKFLYPEEKFNPENDEVSLKVLQAKFKNFLRHAQEIKNRHIPDRTKFIVGMEVEACDISHIEYAKTLMLEHKSVLKFCVGSVHHINGIAIDFDQENWNRALSVAGNNLKRLLIDYFNLQYLLLVNLKPLIVGHFDLFKLLIPRNLIIDEETGTVLKGPTDGGVHAYGFPYVTKWGTVRELIVRNLKYIKSYGGAVEINTSALRKNLPEPYPGKDVCELVKKYCSGRFVLSDDAHALSQIGVCYDEALNYMTEELKLQQLFYLAENDNGELLFESTTIEDVKNDAFWIKRKEGNSSYAKC